MYDSKIYVYFCIATHLPACSLRLLLTLCSGITMAVFREPYSVSEIEPHIGCMQGKNSTNFDPKEYNAK